MAIGPITFEYDSSTRDGMLANTLDAFGTTLEATLTFNFENIITPDTIEFDADVSVAPDFLTLEVPVIGESGFSVGFGAMFTGDFDYAQDQFNITGSAGAEVGFFVSDFFATTLLSPGLEFNPSFDLPPVFDFFDEPTW
ncbi:MAG: hypothetical protein ACFBRM_00940 [Pikeienuella sp.]